MSTFSSSSTSARDAATAFSATSLLVTVPIVATDKLVFASDIEGNYDYFCKFVDSSTAFTRTSSPLHLSHYSGRLYGCDLVLNPDYIFVYVGDVCDRGDGDCRLLYDLVFLKDTYPSRVFLILGNRDMNKMRFLPELDPEIVAVDVDPAVFWTRSAPLTPWPSRVDKLKWMLSDNMGSPDSFQHRKNEVSNLLRREISDDEVLESYMDLVDPSYLFTKKTDDLRNLYSDSIEQLGYSHSDTLTHLFNLACDYLSKGNVDVAIALFKDCLEKRRSSLGELHPDSLTSLDHLACAYNCKGESDIASAIFNDCLEKRKQVLGGTHPDNNTAASLSNLSRKLSGGNEFSRTFGGLLLRYLLGSSIGLLIGDILVIHGGVNDINMGWIPPVVHNSGPWELGNVNNLVAGDMAQMFERLYRFRVFDNTDNSAPAAKVQKRDCRQELIDWLVELEGFKMNEVLDFINNIRGYIDFYVQQTESLLAEGIAAPCRLWSKIGSHLHYQPGSRLLAYGMSVTTPAPGNDNRVNGGVIYTSYIYSSRNNVPAHPNKLNANTCRFCERCGIARIVVGHQPIGDMPLVINNGRIQVIMLDTSYSVNVKWRPQDVSTDFSETADGAGVSGCFPDSPFTDEEAFAAASPQLVINKIDQASLGINNSSSTSAAGGSGSSISNSIGNSSSNNSSSNNNNQSRRYWGMKEVPAKYVVNPKNTRGFSIGHVEVLFKTTADGTVVSDLCHFHGRLSNGFLYSHHLHNLNDVLYEPPTSSADLLGGGKTTLCRLLLLDSRGLERRLSDLIGMQTKGGGWILRSYGVIKNSCFDHPSSTTSSTTAASSASVSMSEAGPSQGIVLLLSYTKDFSCYNRLVSLADLRREGIRHDGQQDSLSGPHRTLDSCFEYLPF